MGVWDVCACEGTGGTDASRRSHQRSARVPEGGAPTQLSLPVTCMHQPPPGSGCQRSRALPLPGVPAQVDPVSCLGPHFFPRLFLSHNGRSGLTLTFHGSWTRCLSHKSQTERPAELRSFRPVHISPHSFSFSTRLKLEGSRERSTETKRRDQESTSVLQMPTAIEQLLSLASPSQTHSSLPPLFFSSFAHLRLHHPMGHSRNH